MEEKCDRHWWQGALRWVASQYPVLLRLTWIWVSQFTLLANVKKGAKPDFHAAAKGDAARTLYNLVLDKVANGMVNGKNDVGDGVFGAMMDVALVNDGPVTIELDTEKDDK